MFNLRSMVKLSACACLTFSLTAHAEITPILFMGFITEGAGANTTSGSYLDEIGSPVGMVFPLDFDVTEPSNVSFPAPGTTEFYFTGEGVNSLAFYYDSENEAEALANGFGANFLTVSVHDDVDLTGTYGGEAALDGIFDVVDLSFETIGSRGEGVKTEHTVSLIGAGNCLQSGWTAGDCDLMGMFGYWRDEMMATGDELGFAHIEIAGIDMFGPVHEGPSPVPVPSAAWLFASALIGMAAFRSRH